MNNYNPKFPSWSNTATTCDPASRGELNERMRTAFTKMEFMPPLPPPLTIVWIGGEWYMIDAPDSFISDWPGVWYMSEVSNPHDWNFSEGAQLRKEERTMKRQFEVEYPAEVLVNANTMNDCLKTQMCLDSGLARQATVTDITDELKDINPSDHVVPYPSYMEWIELHVLLNGARDRIDSHQVVEGWLHEYVFMDENAFFDNEKLPCSPVDLNGSDDGPDLCKIREGFTRNFPFATSYRVPNEVE